MRAIWLRSYLTDTTYLAAGALGTRFVGSKLQRALARRRYGSLAAHYDAEVVPQPGYLRPLTAAMARLAARPRTMLDVCTGTGAATGAVLRRFPECRAFAVDLSPAMLTRAVANSRDAGTMVHFAAADAAHLPFRDGTFELVTVQNAFPVPRELVRVTRPAGLVILSYSTGRLVPPWIIRSMVRHLLALGCDEVDTQQVDEGRYFMARRTPETGRA